ncbi:MAG: cytochrome c [Ignavibacteria bacterium]|nr:cytochrome c [Ignavibacteria bacterium]
MKTILKIVLYLAILAVVGIGALLAYVKFALPDVDKAQDLKVELTPERIARGSYLANHVTVCMDCHSTRDFSKFSGPVVEGTLGKGGDRFDETMGFPGVYYSKNITPAGLSGYTDGELYRVITTGVTKEGRAMFPVMPYPYYSKMDPEDIKSIIAYLRSLPSIESEVPESKSNFPMNFILNTIPRNADPQKVPSKSDKVAYGSYLANAAGCIECHTQVDKGQIIKELQFSGGREFQTPDGNIIRTSNITPDEETGIGKWTEQEFIRKFKSYADSGYVLPSVAPGEFNTFMPWTMYAGMNTDDLSAIYAYLRTIPPRKNLVTKFSKAGVN